MQSAFTLKFCFRCPDCNLNLNVKHLSNKIAISLLPHNWFASFLPTEFTQWTVWKDLSIRNQVSCTSLSLEFSSHHLGSQQDDFGMIQLGRNWLEPREWQQWHLYSALPCLCRNCDSKEINCISKYYNG